MQLPGQSRRPRRISLKLDDGFSENARKAACREKNGKISACTVYSLSPAYLLPGVPVCMHDYIGGAAAKMKREYIGGAIAFRQPDDEDECQDGALGSCDARSVLSYRSLLYTYR